MNKQRCTWNNDINCEIIWHFDEGGEKSVKKDIPITKKALSKRLDELKAEILGIQKKLDEGIVK